MITIDPKYFIQTMYEKFMRGRSVYNTDYSSGTREHKTRAIVFSFSVSISDRGKDTSNSAEVKVLVTNWHQAFVAVHNHFANADNPNLEWRNVGNHDSEWISAVSSDLSELYFKLCASVNSKKAPVELHQFTHMSYHNGLTFVEVTMVDDNERDSNSYWKKIKTIKELTVNEFVDYGNYDNEEDEDE